MHETDFDDIECHECGEEILEPGRVYEDGEEIICPACHASHSICCDSEGGHLHGPGDTGG